MRNHYYQVTGRGPLAIDYPGGKTTAHRPGQIIGPISPTNNGIQRGLRTKRLRALSDREAKALRNHAAVAVTTPLAAPSAPAFNPDIPVVIVDDEPPKASR